MPQTAEERMHQLANVFDAISATWSESGSAKSPTIARELRAAKSSTEPTEVDPLRVGLQFYSRSTLAPKLQGFVADLDTGEQEEFQILMSAACSAAETAAREPTASRHLAPQSILEVLDLKLANGDLGGAVAGTPTVTVVTITTTIASHPIIGCNASFVASSAKKGS